MKTITLNTDTAKIAYNWFFHAFYPSYKKDDRCTVDDIKIMKSLEKFLIESGE